MSKAVYIGYHIEEKRFVDEDGNTIPRCEVEAAYHAGTLDATINSISITIS